MSKKLLLIIVPILVAIIGLIGVLTYLLLASPSTQDMYFEKIQTAQRYMDSGDVDQAVLFYQEAIEADEKQPEPYLMLAKIYFEDKHDAGKCLDILYKGYGILGTEEIKSAIDYYKAMIEETPTLLLPSEAGEDRKGSINVSLLDVLASYTYHDYNTHFTLQSENKNTRAYSATYAQMDAVFEYRNIDGQPQVFDEVKGVPYDNARPTSIKVNDLGALIIGVDGGVTKDDLAKFGAQEISFHKPDSEIENYYIVFTYKNCTLKVECDENGVISNTNGYNSIIPPVSDATQNTVLSGNIYNATDNSLVKNAVLNFRIGKNAETGAVYKKVDAVEGTYSVELEANDYTVEIVADGFITEYYEVYVPQGADLEQSFVISPNLGANQMRFVVEWTNTQYDLYIHIKGSPSSGGTVDYWESRYQSTGDISNNLGGFDSGVQNGKRYTSATIMDYRGKYEFHVHAGYDLFQKQDLLNAGAVLKIYKDNNSQPITVDVPDEFITAHDYWTVCSVQNGNITYID